jgi:chemotaxis protein MotA
VIDLATIIGLVSGIIVVGAGIYLTVGGKVEDAMVYLDLPSLFITIGGATGATITNFSFGDLKGVFKVTMSAFLTRYPPPLQLIKDFRRYAEIARRDGVLALDSITGELRDPFLVRGIQLAVDGTDPGVIEQLLNTELDYIQSRHDKGKRVLTQFATYCPAFGMIGTLIGLVYMLVNLSDPTKLGPAMAVALITTLYGALAAYLIVGPIADKLDLKNQDEVLVKEIMCAASFRSSRGTIPGSWNKSSTFIFHRVTVRLWRGRASGQKARLCAGCPGMDDNFWGSQLASDDLFCHAFLHAFHGQTKVYPASGRARPDGPFGNRS